VILTDTNILLRALYPDHPHYALAKRALQTLRHRAEPLCVTPQNIIEFWTVATRAREHNGLGLQLAEVVEEVKDIRALFRLLPDTPEILDIWIQLVIDHNVMGKPTHDAHIVAAMKAHSVACILTFNGGDFKKFPGIVVIHPDEV
jgi:predicted nucleic acid-binding protein